MTKRPRPAQGYYRYLNNMSVDETEFLSEVKKSRRRARGVDVYVEMEVNEEEGVYSVERIISRRVKQGETEYLVLWEGYPMKDASWVRASDVTTIAIQSYTHPQPSPRLIMDAVSTFLCSLHRSLNLGTIRCCKFNIEFRSDVFNFLFNGKGSRPGSGRGLLYTKADFDSSYFSGDWFLSYDRLGNGCAVEFPIRLQPMLKQGPVRFVKTDKDELVRQKRIYIETVVVSVIKRRC